MKNTKPSPPKSKAVAALLGDVIASRRHPDRSALQATLADVFERIDRVIPSLQELDFTIGDEFQALYSHAGQAMLAALQLRLELLQCEPSIDVRFGIGQGDVPVLDLDKAPFGQDGSAWWRAREALERVKKSETKRRWPKGWRTAFSDESASLTPTVNAFLICRDALLERMDEKDIVLVLGLLRDEDQESLASRLSISQSAVSQRQQRHGAYAVLRAHQEIEGILS